MEFVDKECPKCGKKLGNRKPKDVIKVDKPFDVPSGRLVDFVSLCPFCSENIPVWSGREPEPEPPTEPEPTPEPEE